ncbi:related to PRM1 Pheromone-regulated multispanning membrane protein involved in membrane fusion during mating [Phialocephala subalpina]|uniref:Plasma membrane fusion protein PRM1 n=1 Tax=Phialocephala subalpina TaxID=576137 RepID=A0A1L7WKA8_9HELO|nr:related to PRM1 Pheromone-regulated multispanning membrane protein involved in membrane fusion during mating [Phialocephala subalpina]
MPFLGRPLSTKQIDLQVNFFKSTTPRIEQDTKMNAVAGLKRLLASHTEMSSARMPPQSFPAIPSSLNAGDHEMRDWNGAQDQRRFNTLPQYTPYLGLPARLSQVWINRWTVLIILIICRLLLATKEINHDLASAKSEALSACTSVENVGSAMASMPHYLSTGVNAMAADGVTKAINGLMQMLSLTVTGVEEIVLFYINMLTSTYVCLITLVVAGSLHAAIALIEDVANFVNSTIGSLTGDLATGVNDFQNGLNSFLKTIDNIGSVFGGKSTPPTLNLSSQITSLQNIKIDPTQFDAELTKLNASIPDFAEVHNFTNNVIKTPFELVKGFINSSMAAYTFDQSVFPVPQKQALTFCSDNQGINNFFGGLTKVVFDARKILIIVLSIIAVVVCIPMAFQAIWGWRTMKDRATFIKANAYDPIDVVYIASRPYTTTAGLKVSERWFKTEKARILTRWFVAYITTLPALFVLALGVAGLLTCLFQFLVLKAIEKEVPVLVHEVGDFADVVVSALNNASTAWALGANAVINSTNTKVNHDVFGWVNTTTTALNDTLNTFSDEMTKALNVTFGGTILYQPVTGLYECLIGLKIAAFENVITWVQDNAHVTFPEFRTDVFSLGAEKSISSNSSTADSFLSSPGNTTTDGITNAVVKVTTKLEEAIRQEAIIAACLVGVWFIVVLMGAARVIYALLTRDKTRAEGGAVGYTGDNRAPPSPRTAARNEPSIFPDFSPNSAMTPYPTRSHDEMTEWPAAPDYPGEEKMMGSVGHRKVETSMAPEYERNSTYGYMVDVKR